MRWFLIALAVVGITVASGAGGLGAAIIFGTALLLVVGVLGEREIEHQDREIADLKAKLQQRDHALQALLDGASRPARRLLSDQPSGPEPEAERDGG